MSGRNHCVIFNPAAGSADRIHSIRSALADATFLETSDANDARRIAANVDIARFKTVIVAGGDGTISQVIDGVMQRPKRPVLGIIPSGTGNDLSRMLAIPTSRPRDAIETILQRRIRTIDVIRARFGKQQRWCINVAAGGFTGQMNEVMTDDLKQKWGPLAYLRGAVKVLPDLKHYHTTIRVNARPAQEIFALNVIVANGRTAGGGIDVAPLANPEDGLLDIVVVKSGSMLELTGVAARLLAGNYMNSDVVAHRRAKRVAIRSEPGMWFNLDGELISNEPVTFSIVPRAIRVIVGSDYTPVPEAAK